MDELASDSTDRLEQSEPDATFVAVLDHLESWEPVSMSTATKAGHLRSHLERGLNDDDTSVWERDIVERRQGSMAADLVVNGEIGIKLVAKTGSAGHRDLISILRLLSERYNYLAIYWLDPSPAGTDSRRNLERRASAHRSELEALRFVERSRGGSDPAGRDGSTVDILRPAGVLLAGGTFVVGSGIVAWLLTRAGGFTQLFLLTVAGLFALSLVFGVLIAH